MSNDIKDYVERYPTYIEALDQIEELKAENERLSNILKATEMVKKEESAKLEKAGHDVKRYKIKIQKLQQQLKEKDERIETLQGFLERTTFRQECTKQVCDNLALSLVEFSKDFTMSRDEILEWLQKYKDQIEKGN